MVGLDTGVVYPPPKPPSCKGGVSNEHSGCAGSAHGVSTRTTYKTVAKTSEVDDQLFAAKGQQFHNEHMENIQYLQGLQKHNKPWLSPPEPPLSRKDFVPNAEKWKKHQSKTSAYTPEDSDTVIITKDDMEKIKERSVILTEEQRLALKKHKEAERDRIHAVANQRKQMMLKMEAERRKKSGRLTDAEILRMQNEDRTKAEALRQMEENLDDAKLMNRMMNYARCVTIRDGQLHEKGDKERWEEQDKMRWHHIMEMSRVQKIKEHDTAEARKKYFRYEGAAVIRKQMAENESMRKINEEIKEQEGRKIRRESERMLKEDQDIAEAKRIAGRKLLIEILKANDDAQEARIKAKEFEKEEEARRQVYVHEKEKRDLAYQEAQDKIKKEREMETARLRALQERAQDKQAVIDGVRALRVQEEHEREWREKERAEAEKIRLMYEDLARAREEQKIYKLKLLADQAQEEQIAYYRIAQSQKAALIEARRQAEAAHEANIKNKEAVIKQIEQNAEKRARAFREKFEEGERLRQQIRVEKLRLEDIKERKLKVLAKEGVPPKYQVELAKHKIVIH
ncbi:cilia- and flagella-associated protein 45 [Marchantia polymorpha subsp. ruderalis]|uniref:Cilia- and flagella-associated protein 45 n=2 Tax=Marchantia polymorpha TaxID=3197 RepID=A0AAF6AWY7_MARPO|nr:hypothetical protein MARPO_0212s0006 [Marchantia polymorpha]PTQ27228.1 hypothetical protein MARPO_0212s0006 [Marchantia polymorpha]BBN04271.1 hypothetical protein Mp_3g03200 [Marchantia polymorpha subsp. ruderalis]BBN04272.1 hypothetical protein Mp_3g03200 [Marchantia polymorpha subsp. ruderalis]|eukprot:PTQ27227.1 hypothetical protein MARPO_0212s0006 [Marchantia polymorpha]